jgi:hypothetical protein
MGEGTGGGKEERHRMKRRERRRGKERDWTGETKSDQMGKETETWSFLSCSVMGLVSPGLFAIHS